jgi:hypothetical protein
MDKWNQVDVKDRFFILTDYIYKEGKKITIVRKLQREEHRSYNIAEQYMALARWKKNRSANWQGNEHQLSSKESQHQ